ncbi:MAG: META domain-containing protein [Caldilineaceae bacterium]|nr:META domain-containing protein [Caldilineaceae bacterium]
MNKHIGRMLVLMLGYALALAGCSPLTATPAPATEIAATAEAVADVAARVELVNTAWEVESFGGPDDTVPVLPGTHPSLTLMVERYAGYGGCDWFLGVYGVDGSSIRLETPAMTEGGCTDAALIDQEGTFTSLLWNVTQYTMEGDKLLLYMAEDQLAMTLVPLEPLALEGPTWEMQFISTQPAYWQPLIPGTHINATFDGEMMRGFAGCNDYTAKYTRTDNQFAITDVTVTEKSCASPDGVMDQEAAYLSMLETVGGILKAPRTFEFQDGDGAPLMLYHGEAGP